MPDTPNIPQIGSLVIDVTSLAGFLVDLPPGAMQGMRTEQDGFDGARAEILANQPTYGDLAGITQGDFAQFQTLGEQIAQIRAQLPAARKLLEILIESEAKLDDQRQRLVSAFAQSAESRAKATGNQELLARYQKTREYRSAIANKAAKTRKKNAEQSAPPAGDAQPPKT